MAKKKADTYQCLHCAKDFIMPLKWCPKCEDHFLATDGFLLDKDVCDRCYNGLNDAYLKRKKGSPARVAKALAKILEKHGPWVLTPLPPALVKMDKQDEFDVPYEKRVSFLEDDNFIYDWTWPLQDLIGRTAYYDSDIRD